MPTSDQRFSVGPQLIAEFAYLAGIVDGEGTIAFHQNTLWLRVTNTDRPLLDWIQERWGGSVVNDKGKRESAERLLAGKKWAGRWVITGARAEDLLRQIRPFLIVKAARADECLDLWHSTGPRHRNRTYAGVCLQVTD